VTFRFGFQRIAGLAKRSVPTAANRRPRNESHLFFLAVVERALRVAVGDVILVLDADNRQDLFRLFDFCHRAGKGGRSGLYANLVRFRERFFKGRLQLPKTATGKVQKYILRGKPAISKQ